MWTHNLKTGQYKDLRRLLVDFILFSKFSPNRELLLLIIDDMKRHKDWYRALKYTFEWELEAIINIGKCEPITEP